MEALAPYRRTCILGLTLVLLNNGAAAALIHRPPLSIESHSIGGHTYSISRMDAATNGLPAQVDYHHVYEAGTAQGWTSSPNGRGTIDIIYSSCITILLCSWTALCINVGRPQWGSWRILHQKNCMACLGLIGPEFIFQLALGQWSSARRSVEEFKSSGYTDWTLTHAFLADMGGFMLHTRDWVPFPLNAKQVHYLVVGGYVPYTQVHIDIRHIEDKNKGGGMVRLITVWQISWYTISTIGRVVQHLAITTLELVALGFIVCTLGTYYFWTHKPMDVGQPIVICPAATLDEILRNAGDCAKQPYRQTPLDFVAQEPYTWRLYWMWWMGLLRGLGINFATKKRPNDKIPDDYFHAITGPKLLLLFISQISYVAVHVSGWNIYFPTQIERLLWHISTLLIVGSVLCYWLVEILMWQLLPLIHWRSPRQPARSRSTYPAIAKKRYPWTTVRSKLRNVCASVINDTPDHDPEFYVPLRALMPITMAGFFYCTARAYIVVESFANLRSLPPSAYLSVNWSSFFPHF